MNHQIVKGIHCLKSVQIRSFFWSVFSRIRTEYGENSVSPYSVRMRENTDQKKLHIWTLHAVIMSKMNKQCLRIVSKVMTYSLALCTLFRKCLCLFNLKSSQLFAWKNIKKIWWCQKRQKQTLHCIKLSSNICYIDAANRIAILLTSLSLKKIEEDFNRKNWDQL